MRVLSDWALRLCKKEGLSDEEIKELEETLAKKIRENINDVLGGKK